jgi:decaprenylphospho-beta-D-erythro-pentofuranosid-2-ulose 2-reductase
MTDHRRVWILGATSSIAHAYARRLACEGATLLLVGRNQAHLDANARDLTARGAAVACVRCCDLARPIDYGAALKNLVSAQGYPDEVIIAYGTLEEEGRAATDLVYAHEIIETNFTSVACWLLGIIGLWDRSSPLTLTVIGSVAGDRGRARNLVYGAAKGGLDRLLEGLQQAYAGTQIRIVRIKPGFVDTPMTAHIAKRGPLWATPEQVAADIERAVKRGLAVVYTPWFWWPIMTIIRLLPRSIFHQLRI